MPKRRQGKRNFARHCGNKRQYDSLDDAEWALENMLDNPEVEHARRLHTYKCDYGEHWHIGKISRVTRN